MLRRAIQIAALIWTVALVPRDAGADPEPASSVTRPKPATQEVVLLERKRQMLMADGRYEEAIPVVRELVAAYETLWGAEGIETLKRVLWLASLYRFTGAWTDAEATYRRVLTALEKARMVGYRIELYALEGVGDVLRERGDLEGAQTVAIELVRRTEPYGPGASLVRALLAMSRVHDALGAWKQGESGLLRALSLVQAHAGPASVETQDVVGSAPTTTEWESRTREGEPDVLMALSLHYLAEGDAAKAKDFAARFVATQEEVTRGKPSRALAVALHIEGRALAAAGDAGGALSRYAKAREVGEAVDGSSYVGDATILRSEARLRLAQGDLSLAEALDRRALPLVEDAYGPEHRHVGDVLSGLALSIAAQGRIGEAVPFAERAATIRDHDAQVVLSVGSEAQKRALAAAFRKQEDAVVSLSAFTAPSDPAAAKLALRTIFRSKGRLVDAAANELSALRKKLGPEEQALFDQLERVTAAIAASAARGEDTEVTATAKQRQGRLIAEQRRLERLIADKSAPYRASAGLVTVEEVAATIPNDAALVEVVQYQPLLLPSSKGPRSPSATEVAWGAPRYAAYVLRQGAVNAVDLGLASEVDKASDDLRRALARSDLSRDPKPVARAAYAKILAPIAPLLGDARHLLWSPDGALTLVPISALADADGRYVVERYLVTHLDSGRDLLRFEPDARPRQGPLLLGAPHFGALPGVSPAEATHRSAELISLGRVGFPPLPSTLREVNAVRAALGRGVELTGERATESVVKRAQAPEVLHIATHGFFLPGRSEQEIARAAGPDATAAETARALAVESPLVRSGIALAGANLRESGADDGILTALEASTLDLTGTELVVLSACETGLGAAVPGDGVYGLRRAFVIAGAETLVMSLWQVDSGRTRELMTAYYGGLAAGLGRSEALRSAQLAFLRSSGTAHPNVWASFIVSGAWAPLRATAASPPKVEPAAHACGCRTAGTETPAGSVAALIAGFAAWRRRLSPRRHTSHRS